MRKIVLAILLLTICCGPEYKSKPIQGEETIVEINNYPVGIIITDMILINRPTRDSWTLAFTTEKGCSDIGRIFDASINKWIFNTREWVNTFQGWSMEQIGLPKCEDNILYWEYLELPKIPQNTLIQVIIKTNNEIITQKFNGNWEGI